MSYLAYDPDRVDGLLRAMGRSLEELRRARCDDPEAATATRVLRALAMDVETVWLPLTRRTATSTSLTAAGRRPAALSDLPNSLAYLMNVGYGWSVAVDPASAAPGAITAEEARALGARMNSADATDVATDPAEVRWLSAQLERIARDPFLAGQFLANFHEWAPWGDALGRQRALLLAGIEHDVSVTVTDLDEVFAGLAHVQRTVPGPIPWLTEMNPYAAAATVRHLALSGAALAEVIDTVLQQRPLADLDALPGPNAADLLFPLLTGDAVATQRFLVLSAAHPEVLFDRTSDSASGFRLALEATDPAVMSVAVARGIVPAFVDHFANTDPPCDDQCYSGAAPPDDWRGFLVDLVSPWMLQFSPQNDEWSLSVAQRNRMLPFVLGSDASLRRFLERADRVQDGFITSLASGPPHALDELGAFMAMIGGFIMSDRVQDATDRGRARDMLATLAGMLTTALPGVAVGAGLALAITIVNTSTSPDPARERHRAGFGADLAVTTAGAAIAAQLTEQWKAEGALPDDFPPPPVAHADAELPSQDFMLAFVDWRDTLPGGEFGRLADRLTRQVYAVINPGMMGEHSVTLFLP